MTNYINRGQNWVISCLERAGGFPLVGVKACGLLRFAAAVPVTPTTPVRFLLGSSVELPLASVRAEPPVESKVLGVMHRSENASGAQKSCQLCRIVPVFFFCG